MRTRVALGTLAALVLCAAGAAAARLPGSRSAADRASWRSLLHWPASCESGWRENGIAGAGIELDAVAGGARLVVVECAFAAYQATDMLYLVEASGRLAGPLSLRTYDIGAGGRLSPASETQILGILHVSAATDSLTVLDELRSLGDCGLYSSFRLLGARLVPTSVRAQTTCNGRPPLAPSGWPRVALPAGD